jgi:CheY-like chemotaxis protein
MGKGLSVCLLAHDMRFAFSLHSILSASHPEHRFHLCRFEKEMIQYLQGVGIYENRAAYPFPDLLLLDAHHPECDDLFVLSWLRLHPEFTKVPCVLLNEEASTTLGQKAFDLGVNACVIPRKDTQALGEILDGISELKRLLSAPALAPERKTFQTSRSRH